MSADRKQLRQSLSRYRQLLTFEPDHIGHLEQLARLSLALGKPKRAADYLVSRADVLARRGEFGTALADCDSALSLVARHKPAVQMRTVIEQIRARHRAAALMKPTRQDPSIAPRAPEPESSDKSAPARPFDPPTMELQVTDLLDAAPLAASGAAVGDPLDGAAEPDELESFLGPVVDASALLAVYEVDGVDVVPVATRAPAQLPMPILSPPAQDGSDVPTLAVRDPLGIEDRDTLNTLPPSGETMMARSTDEPDASVRARPVTLSQVEGVVHMVTRGPAAHGSQPDLPDTPLLKALPRTTRADLRRTGTQVTYAAGDVLVAPLTPRAAVYVVLSGAIDLIDERADPAQKIGILNSGDLLGDLEIVHGGPWRFKAIATEPTSLLRVDDGVLDALRQRFPAFGALLRAAASRRHAGWLLGANPMFRVLGPNERNLMTVRMLPRPLSPQAPLCREGEALDGIVMVASGALIVRRDGQSIARLGAGRFAGLGALGRGDGRSSAAISAGPHGALLYALDHAALAHLCAFPAIRDLIEAAGRQRA
ncbi:MAG: CRP-like cAMP-binding protein [Bradymonadia bacterium]|jgi:CRP-like cAMP-binding protein